MANSPKVEVATSVCEKLDILSESMGVQNSALLDMFQPVQTGIVFQDVATVYKARTHDLVIKIQVKAVGTKISNTC